MESHICRVGQVYPWGVWAVCMEADVPQWALRHEISNRKISKHWTEKHWSIFKEKKKGFKTKSQPRQREKVGKHRSK